MKCTSRHEPVIKEEFFASLNRSLGKDSNTMISIDHHYLSIAVGIDRMVCKTDLVALTCCIHYKIYTKNNPNITACNTQTFRNRKGQTVILEEQT